MYSIPDAAMCKFIGAVARDTGMAGGIKAAYLAGDAYVYGIVIDGGNKMPKGSYSFRMEDYGNIEIL